MLKNFAATNGIAVTKRFIDACLSNYSGNANYPGVNFSFMQTYMKERYLPQCLKVEEMAQIIEVNEENNAVDLDWL
jgi:hypothetical protein